MSFLLLTRSGQEVNILSVQSKGHELASFHLKWAFSLGSSLLAESSFLKVMRFVVSLVKKVEDWRKKEGAFYEIHFLLKIRADSGILRFIFYWMEEEFSD